MDMKFVDRVLGKLFGFPQCCVDFFCANRGTIALGRQPSLCGFVLCPVCASMCSFDDVIREINIKRVIPRRFPTLARAEDLQQIFADPRWNHGERAWLVENSSRFTQKQSFELDTVFKMHQDLTDAERQYAADRTVEPGREDLLFALFEDKKDAIIQQFLEANFKFLKGRILDQVRSGTIKL